MTWSNDRLALLVTIWGGMNMTILAVIAALVVNAHASNTFQYATAVAMLGVAFLALWLVLAIGYDGRSRRVFERLFGSLAGPLFPDDAGWSE